MTEKRNVHRSGSYPRVVKNTDSETENSKSDFKAKIRRHRLAIVYRTILVCVLIAAAIVIYVIYSENKIYSGYTVESEQEWTDNSSLEVLSYQGDILTYSKDGIVCSNTKGKVQWNQSFEMQNPILAMRGEYVVIGDYNGTTIYVMNEKGTKWMIDTRMPIRALDVSEKGTVVAVLDDGPITWIYLYNKEGEVLLWSQTTMADFGYPLNVAISNNSMMLAVSYLYADSGSVSSRVAFYNLDDVGDNYQDNLVSGFNYKDAVVPVIRFLDEENSFAVADNRLMIYNGDQIPASTKEIILIEEIQSVFYGEDYIGLVFLDVEGSAKYRMDTYDISGNLVYQYTFDREYSDILFENGFVYIYNESGCDIYNMKGVLKYTGDFEMPVECLIPGKYKEEMIWVGRDSIQHVTLN